MKNLNNHRDACIPPANWQHCPICNCYLKHMWGANTMGRTLRILSGNLARGKHIHPVPRVHKSSSVQVHHCTSSVTIQKPLLCGNAVQACSRHPSTTILSPERAVRSASLCMPIVLFPPRRRTQHRTLRACLVFPVDGGKVPNMDPTEGN